MYNRILQGEITEKDAIAFKRLVWGMGMIILGLVGLVVFLVR
jgi:hypothetical protein